MIHLPANPQLHLAFDLLGWAAGAALGTGLYRWRLKATAERLAATAGPGYFMALAVGALAGAWVAGSMTSLAAAHPALSHSVLGALVGAIAAVEAYKAARGITGSTGGMFVGPFALGAAVGRWGCLLAGLPDYTYGLPTRLAWAVDLGDGIGRHPVQVYESVSMAGFLAVYLLALRRRAPWAMERGFYALCVWYGVQRFAWEFLKPYPDLVGPLNLFQLLCGGLVAYGFVFWRRDLHRRVRAGA